MEVAPSVAVDTDAIETTNCQCECKFCCSVVVHIKTSKLPWFPIPVSISEKKQTHALQCLFIHSFSLMAYPSQGRRVWVGPGFTLDKSVSSSQGWHTETNNHSPSHSHLQTPVNLHVFELWEEAGEPGQNPRRHGENVQTSHRKVLPQPGIKPRILLYFNIQSFIENCWTFLFKYVDPTTGPLCQLAVCLLPLLVDILLWLILGKKNDEISVQVAQWL